MLEYLSNEWIRAVEDAARADAELVVICSDADLVLQQVISDGPSGSINYTIRLATGDISVRPGGCSDTHVTLSQKYSTSVAVYSGQLNALEAVQRGQIRITGDSSILLGHRRALTRLQFSFDAVRSRTADPGAGASSAIAEKPKSRRNIVITGFMGTGKTVVGRKLARKLQFEFVDTDHIIENEHGPIAQIFAEKGEAEFRRIEREVAVGLRGVTGTVISTGGAMMLDPANVAILGEDATIICLVAPVEEILTRLANAVTSHHRPLLDVADPQARIRELLAEREQQYGQFMQVNTSGMSPSQVAELIVCDTT